MRGRWRPALSNDMKNARACHPERSEGSPQFPLVQQLARNCRGPSLRSGWHDGRACQGL